MAQAYGENLKQAMDTLRTHKLRSALTVFGVVLGVSVIMLVAALITGFDQKIQENVNQFGADTAFITKWDQGRHGGPPPLEEIQRKPLTLDDAKAIQDSCPAVKQVTAFLQTDWDHPHTVRTKAGSVTAIDFRGVQSNFGDVYANAATLEGRFISEGDDLHKEKVVMLGENVAPVLFPEGHPIGKDVMIDGSDFQVVGVVEKPKGGFGMGDEDRRVLIPFSTFKKVFPTADEVTDARPRPIPTSSTKPSTRFAKSSSVAATSPTAARIISRIATAEQEVARVPQDRADGCTSPWSFSVPWACSLAASA